VCGELARGIDGLNVGAVAKDGASLTDSEFVAQRQHRSLVAARSVQSTGQLIADQQESRPRNGREELSKSAECHLVILLRFEAGEHADDVLVVRESQLSSRGLAVARTDARDVDIFFFY